MSNAERLSKLAQAHNPKGPTSRELEALEIQKAQEEARRLREKNLRAVQRQAAARALAAGQETPVEAPQPNSAGNSGRRSPLRTRTAANVEVVATKVKAVPKESRAVDATKENRATDVAKIVPAKKTTTAQRPCSPLAKKSGPVVAATRA